MRGFGPLFYWRAARDCGLIKCGAERGATPHYNQSNPTTTTVHTTIPAAINVILIPVLSIKWFHSAPIAITSICDFLLLLKTTLADFCYQRTVIYYAVPRSKFRGWQEDFRGALAREHPPRYGFYLTGLRDRYRDGL
jgi:hypothetical protein